MVRRGRHAFTLIEILVVIGIILLLIAIGVIGFQHLDKATSEKAIQTRFQVCNSILNDYEASVGTLNAIEGLGPSGSQPSIYKSIANGGAVGQLTNPGDVNVGSYNRYSQKGGGSILTVINTGKILSTMSHVPSVKTLITQLPASALLPPDNLVNGAPGPWLDNDNTVMWPAHLPVILDPWKNPIIYVPATGLPNVIVTRGTSTATVTVTAVDGRPFWASAGQDGNFSNGDDNLYSTAVVMK
ncbi:MAG TPA: prepilin-type N-terminal cleavage/methylation domain-containing protein [Tepidisphaeraceae bacterium]|jgi:prepilin-type N-terminal cleavage/methylation domain-containing protein|nr:prepilin-type N-terminal cleavage/methylation domain-containing protein [Tepidisphaeraceae bacterium]